MVTEERFAPEPLKMFGTRVLTALGVPGDDAALVADSLVQADLWGHSSHGLLRLPWYAARLRAGAPGIGPHVVQLAGRDARWMGEAARRAEGAGAPQAAGREPRRLREVLDRRLVVAAVGEDARRLEQHLLLRRYDGFMKKGRVKVRGRQRYI